MTAVAQMRVCDVSSTERDLRTVCDMLSEIGKYEPSSAEDLGRARVDMWTRADGFISRDPLVPRTRVMTIASFFFALATGTSSEEDLEVVRSHTAEDLFQALLRTTRHDLETHFLCLLLVAGRRREDTLYPNLGGGRLHHDSLAAQVAAGTILTDLEKHDPHLQIAGPGIIAYYERSCYGTRDYDQGGRVDCSAMVGSILATLECIHR
jgi:hypothetical protein